MFLPLGFCLFLRFGLHPFLGSGLFLFLGFSFFELERFDVFAAQFAFFLAGLDFSDFVDFLFVVFAFELAHEAADDALAGMR
ncbi:MAG TPA: hypothetical protein VGN08_14155 [Solirubrobacteraceae bacterium]